MRPLVAIEHHRVRAPPAEGDEPLLGGGRQGRADALPAVFGVDGEPVQVAAPAVEAGDDRADEPAVSAGEQEGVRVTGVEQLNSGEVVGDACAFGGGFRKAGTSARSGGEAGPM